MKCIGCGIELQSTDKDLPGYTPKPNASYCQRCFRLTHYGKLEYSYKQQIKTQDILNRVASMDALILWIVDLFDLESAWKEDFSEKLNGKDILMVCTKRDLLPDSIGEQKLGNYLLMRLKESNIKVKGIVVIGEHGYDGQKELREITEQLRNGRDVILIGTANAGKSTVLHHVFEIDTLTISKYPGTTLDFVPIPMDDYTLYDTPGFHSPYSIQTLIQDQAMEEIMPKNKIKPRVYQLTDDQSFAIGGILRIDFEGSKKYSITAYFADGVKIHRGKISDADRLWQQHKGDLLSPVIEGSYFKKKRVFIPTEKKVDLVIVGLGWICIHGDVKITVSGSDFAEVYMRKAMI